MKLSVSNIAWDASRDQEMYMFLQENGFDGLELAPTRIFPVEPYEKLVESAIFAKHLEKHYGLAISSMQSIWFGKTQSIFGPDQDELVDYTEKALHFATTMGCSNLVFGCPRNRNVPEGNSVEEAIPFFQKIAREAERQGTVIALEPNPPIYGTNFINTTQEAIVFVGQIRASGLRINIDTGTILHNNEGLTAVEEHLNLVNHVHISEPYLAPIERRRLHKDFAQILRDGGYQGFVSLEQKDFGDISLVKETALYVREVFG